ncbi:Dicer-like protein 1 [Orbilia oligospora]|uniref:Dicer-like protein 1 n=1 Tax=Orbilia oligospora TaxID=2813651 RepID=A0A7C8Q326_ORBOL|nr:Dicer-like protein 1 [Orbilia oligospora]
MGPGQTELLRSEESDVFMLDAPGEHVVAHDLLEHILDKQAREFAARLPNGNGLLPDSIDELKFKESLMASQVEKPNDENDGSDNEGHEPDIDSDSEEDPDDAVIVTQTKRIAKAKQKQTFEEWFSKKAYDIETNPKKLPQDNELVSIKDLLSNTAKAIITDPREYQLELFERAKMDNTIAVLDTGSGKTLIATLLIRWMLELELEERKSGRSPKVCVFLVNSVTLVFQQAAVLECNLDAQVGKYCGDMGTDLWTKSQWDARLKSDRIIVATADILWNCLTHSFIRMSDICLLIFDECHHTKKQHAYARIMRDFYETEKEENRPRIFGMTASPVDARVDPVKAAHQLERLMHSRICTTSNPAYMRKFLPRPEEMTLEYQGVPTPVITELNSKLSPYRNTKCLSSIFGFIDNVASRDLGPWCSDFIWQVTLTELESARQERRAGTNSASSQREGSAFSLEDVDKEIQLIKEARAIVEAHEFQEPSLGSGSFSPKLFILLRFLVHAFDQHPEYKCIIFVTRRHTAQCIQAIFKKVFTQHGRDHLIRLGILVGSSGQHGTDSMTFRAQTLALHRFKKGLTNCLIATAVAEEGLDVPDCNLVIRFDLYDTMIKYVQSRGRARHATSTYIHMVEQNNWTHKRMVQDGQEAEKIMKEFCSKLPEDRLLDKQAPTDIFGPDPTDDMTYIVPETGAKLTLNSSMQILNQFADHLGAEEGIASEHVMYIVQAQPGHGFKCEVKMPEISPIRSVMGDTARSKGAAKRHAAFEACKKLHHDKYLDDYLMPIYEKKLRPMMANAHLAVDSHKLSSYPSQIKPSFWERKEPPVPTRLWATCLTLRHPNQLEKPSQGICLATRDKPPKFPSFSLYFDRGGQSLVDCVTMDDPIICDGNKIAQFNEFTSRFFIDIFNKEFDIQTEKLPYWVLPIKLNKTVASASSIDDMIDWELVMNVFNNPEEEFDLATTPPEFYFGKFVIDRRQGSRRFYILDHEPKYHPYDPIPEGASNAPHTVSIIDYSYSAGKKGWQRWVGELPPDQPVLVADRVLHRLNFLERPTEREKTQNTMAYVVPSPFRVSPLPAKFCTMGLLFPAIITRIDAYLQAYDVCKLLNVQIDLELALEAITKDSDNTQEHDEEPQNKRRGMVTNYERLEFLGDCFLKLGTTIALYSTNPDQDEFAYHVARMVLVCNRSLYKRAVELELYKYIQTEGFSRRLWYPMITLIKGKAVGKTESQRTHRLSDKSVADVCEALIGASLCGGGLDMAARMVTALVNKPIHRINSFKEYYSLYTLPEYQIGPVNASQQELADKIERDMGYKFKYPRLLRSAFTHPSFPTMWEKIPCYERLEFLGDALIDMACVEDLWERFPSKDPQWLTEHKMSMINNRFQGALSVKLKFHTHLRAMGAHINSAVQEYVQLIEEARIASNDSVDYWIDAKQPPKVLPDILEAYVGAIFVDSGFNYDVVTSFFRTHVRPFFTDMSIFDSFAGNHPVTHLTTRMTELGCSDFRIFSKEYKDRDKSYVLSVVIFHDKILAEGKASSKKNSRTNAAKHSLEKLATMSAAEFRKKCTCAEIRKAEAEEREEERVKRAFERENMEL